MFDMLQLVVTLVSKVPSPCRQIVRHSLDCREISWKVPGNWSHDNLKNIGHSLGLLH